MGCASGQDGRSSGGKGGAGGNTGSAEVAKQAPADGHTLLLAASGPMAVNPSLYASMPFNPLTDLAPVIQLSAFPLVLEVHPSLGVKTLAEFLALAKAGKPVLSFASAGNGTPQHLAGELFNTMAGVKMGHIPYRGAGPALNDLIGGQVNVMFDIVGSSLPHIQAGKLIPLAVTSSERAKVLPNVPTMAEAGIAGYQITGWHGIAVRARECSVHALSRSSRSGPRDRSPSAHRNTPRPRRRPRHPDPKR